PYTISNFFRGSRYHFFSYTIIVKPVDAFSFSIDYWYSLQQGFNIYQSKSLGFRRHGKYICVPKYLSQLVTIVLYSQVSDKCIILNTSHNSVLVIPASAN